jgi:hypothetical protein
MLTRTIGHSTRPEDYVCLSVSTGTILSFQLNPYPHCFSNKRRKSRGRGTAQCSRVVTVTSQRRDSHGGPQTGLTFISSWQVVPLPHSGGVTPSSEYSAPRKLWHQLTLPNARRRSQGIKNKSNTLRTSGINGIGKKMRHSKTQGQQQETEISGIHSGDSEGHCLVDCDTV